MAEPIHTLLNSLLGGVKTQPNSVLAEIIVPRGQLQAASIDTQTVTELFDDDTATLVAKLVPHKHATGTFLYLGLKDAHTLAHRLGTHFVKFGNSSIINAFIRKFAKEKDFHVLVPLPTTLAADSTIPVLQSYFRFHDPIAHVRHEEKDYLRLTRAQYQTMQGKQLESATVEKTSLLLEAADRAPPSQRGDLVKNVLRELIGGGSEGATSERESPPPNPTVSRSGSLEDTRRVEGNVVRGIDFGGKRK